MLHGEQISLLCACEILRMLTVFVYPFILRHYFTVLKRRLENTIRRPGAQVIVHLVELFGQVVFVAQW